MSAAPKPLAAAAAAVQARGLLGSECVLLGLLCGVAASISMLLSRQPGAVATLWLANAVAMGFLATSSRDRWPALLASALAGNLVANLALSWKPLTAMAFLPANGVEMLIGGALLRRAGLARTGLRTPLAMLKMFALGAFVPQLIGATLGAATMQSLGLGSFPSLWQNWYEGSAIGSISALALVMAWRVDRAELLRRDLLDWHVPILGMVAGGVTLLSLAHVPFPFVYIAIPLLLAAIVLELTGALAVVLATSLVVSLSLATGVFVPPPTTAQWQQLFVYTAYAAALLPAQLLAAAVADMRDSHERLAAATAELQRANEGLEQFVRIASHDLREPLNTIVQFTGLIENDHGPQMPPEARSWLSLVGRAGSRMRLLLDDVLHYVRVQRAGEDPGQAVELARVLQDVLQSLAGRIRETGASVAVGNLPVVRGHETLLALLFQNLLSNALKFMPADRKPSVRVTCSAAEGMAVLHVTDNGIGIESQDLPKLFQPFQRLHLRKHYDGTGLGLALVRQVATAHGGSVDIESRPDKGTRVIVTLPLEESAARARPVVTRF
jgi:signal transduction histidine kinase